MTISFKDALRATLSTKVTGAFESDGKATISNKEATALSGVLDSIADPKERAAVVSQMKTLLAIPAKFSADPQAPDTLRRAVMAAENKDKQAVTSVSAEDGKLEVTLGSGEKKVLPTFFHGDNTFRPEAFVTASGTQVVYGDNKGIHIFDATTGKTKHVPTAGDTFVGTITEGLTRNGSSRLFVYLDADRGDEKPRTVVIDTASATILKRFPGMLTNMELGSGSVRTDTIVMGPQEAWGAEDLDHKLKWISVDTLLPVKQGAFDVAVTAHELSLNGKSIHHTEGTIDPDYRWVSTEDRNTRFALVVDHGEGIQKTVVILDPHSQEVVTEVPVRHLVDSEFDSPFVFAMVPQSEGEDRLVRIDSATGRVQYAPAN